MANDVTPIDDSEAHSLLTDDEEVLLNWGGEIIEDEDEMSANFVVTGERLIFSLGGGHFRDIGLKHIESVEVSTDVETETEGMNPDAVKGAGMGLPIVGVVAMFAGGFSPFAAVSGFVLILVGAYTYWYGSSNYDRLAENHEVIERPVYHIVLRTSERSAFNMPIYLKTQDEVGTELSKLVQQSK